MSPVGQGDAYAADELLPLVYDELRKLAAQKLAHEKQGQTLQATALVHEAYVWLVGREGQGTGTDWDSRGHFFAAAAKAMRRILVDSARRKKTEKRGGTLVRQDVHAIEIAADEIPKDLLALDEALQELSVIDKPAAKVRRAPRRQPRDVRTN